MEALLFSSPESVSVKQLSELSGLSPSQVRRALKELDAFYKEGGSALQVLHSQAGYCLQLREEHREISWKVSPPQIPPGALRTMAMIAYHQPVTQSELARTLGSRTYDDVRLLRELNLLTVRKSGQTLELSTNRRFSEYFGIEARSRQSLKEWLEKNMNLGPEP